MDSNLQIKKEDPLSDDIGSQNETIKRINDDVLLDNDCHVAIKSEVPCSSPCSQNEQECISNPDAMQIHFETVTCSSSWKIDRETEVEEETIVPDFGSQNVGDVLPENPVMKLGEYNNDHEMVNKIEIKVEPWCLETETSSVCDDIKDGDLPPVTSSRLYTEADCGDSSDKSPLPFAEVSGRDTSFYNVMHHSECDSDVAEITTVEEHVLSEQSEGALYFKHKNCVHTSERPQQCNISDNFTHITHLGSQELTYYDARPYRCKSCDKSFTRLSYLKSHNFIHEGKKPHQCKTCDKSFSRKSNLKIHNVIHEGTKPYQCKTCDKSFTQLTSLKRHILIHEGKKPYRCKTCDKSFSRSSHLERHNLTHEAKKPYQCETCDKSFLQLSNLKTHILTHEDKKPHQCKTCDRSFTQLSHLKRHNLTHEEKKPHQCKTCGKSFIQLSNLITHNLTHEGKKPHQCKTCDKSFTQLSHLKRHNLTHEDKKPHQCKTCDKNFTQLGNLKRHELTHEDTK